MSPSNPQLLWLRRGLASFVGLLALSVTCGFTTSLLRAMGDAVGAKALHTITWGVGIAAGLSGISLLIATAWNAIRLLERSDSERGALSIPITGLGGSIDIEK